MVHWIFTYDLSLQNYAIFFVFTKGFIGAQQKSPMEL